LVTTGKSKMSNGFTIKGILDALLERRRVVRIPGNVSSSNGCVAISYLKWPFEQGVDPKKMRGHTNAGEVLAMVNIFRQLGFRIEVCDWSDRAYCPPKDTRIAIDLHSNLERWNLPDGCMKILHATGAHWLFQNRAELERLEAIRIRKGVALSPRRIAEPSRGVEVADQVTVLGNEFTAETFRFSGKPITRIPISSAYEFPFPENRDHELARRRFLWIGSYGMVHKGLDLVLEAFAGMPELELTVCGRPEKEQDFFKLYEKELKRTTNIHLHGWIDMASSEFAEIARTHAFVIYPSCSEGGAGSVIHCMHAGLTPICTEEASVDLGDFGVPVTQGTVDSVKDACLLASGIAAGEIAERSRASWDQVRKFHTLDAFAKNFARFAASLIGDFQ